MYWDRLKARLGLRGFKLIQAGLAPDLKLISRWSRSTIGTAMELLNPVFETALRAPWNLQGHDVLYPFWSKPIDTVSVLCSPLVTKLNQRVEVSFDLGQGIPTDTYLGLGLGFSLRFPRTTQQRGCCCCKVALRLICKVKNNTRFRPACQD